MATAYELQAQRIETTLSAHKVPARVWQATVTPRFVRFDVTTALGTRITQVERLDEELAFALGARSVRVYREGGVLHVEVPRADGARQVTLGDILTRAKTIPPLCGVLGVDEGGAPLLRRATRKGLRALQKHTEPARRLGLRLLVSPGPLRVSLISGISH